MKNSMLKKTVKTLAAILLSLLLILAAGAIWMYILYLGADLEDEQIMVDHSEYPVTRTGDSLRICRNSVLHLNPYGIWEASLKGSPEELGACMGALGEDLLYLQEKAFTDQIRKMIPSERYLRFLRNLIVIFNRNLKDYIPQEYRDEIYAMSTFGTHEYDFIGTPYFRQLNYHAAHDIGHAMQQYMLVGCSSFSTWGSSSEDSRLLVGRNFDFYVGDDFARNKVLLFLSPEQGYRYASLTWTGMTGVMSGMNEKGLCVTINASKGALPTAAALPISLLARQILQYAKNIEEAFRIASQAETFVSESILIGSAEDGYAAVIEKSPAQTSLFRSDKDYLACTNHFQSEAFQKDRHNLENMKTSDSPYRLKRLDELISGYSPVSETDAATILRDRKGTGGKDIGLTNQKSINLSIAHHSVIFRPEELKMWISTSPWQSGAYLCYDLKAVFSGEKSAAGHYAPLYDERHTLPADTAFLRNDYPDILKYRELSSVIRSAAEKKEILDEKILKKAVEVNPEYFDIYDICGDYLLSAGQRGEAVEYWKKALAKEIPYTETAENIKKKIRKHEQK